ncbi:hypothetical protein Tsubulata_034776, partial [Turnera subulata]
MRGIQDFQDIRRRIAQSEYMAGEISAPKLQSFVYKKSEAVDFSVINLPSLQYADCLFQIVLPPACKGSAMYSISHYNTLLV